ncbi:MAG: hypothetical protein WBD22_00670 [Pyrinomonadaceae bacterium]
MRVKLKFRKARLACIFGVVCVLSPVAFSQNTKFNPKLLVWQERVDRLTDGVIKDSSSFIDSEKAFYLALVAKLSWKFDPRKSKVHLKQSAKIIRNSLESDDRANLGTNLENSQKTIRVIAELDTNLSQELAERVLEISSEKDRTGQHSDLLLLIALQVFEKNPQLAFDIGVKSLTLGNPIEIFRLIASLNAKDGVLADRLFSLALINARRTGDIEFINRLSAAFKTFKGATISDASRLSYLELLADLMMAGTISEQERPAGCKAASIAARLLDQFDHYLPTRSLTLRQQVQICLAYISHSDLERTRAATEDNQPQTVDDLIRAASNTNDRFLKSDYFYRAISKLAAEMKFDEILSLLDGMTKEETKVFPPGAWDGWRGEYSLQLALQKVKSDDLPAVYRILDRTPNSVRPYVRLSLANKLSERSYADFILEILEKTRKELNSFELPPKDVASSYISLARLYVKVQPGDAPAVFVEAVKAINNSDSENKEDLPEKNFAPLRDYVPLPNGLLEANEFIVFSGLANISSKRSRVRLKLGLLESSIQGLLVEKNTIEKLSRKLVLQNANAQ